MLSNKALALVEINKFFTLRLIFNHSYKSFQESSQRKVNNELLLIVFIYHSYEYFFRPLQTSPTLIDPPLSIHLISIDSPVPPYIREILFTWRLFAKIYIFFSAKWCLQNNICKTDLFMEYMEAWAIPIEPYRPHMGMWKAGGG